MIGIRVLRGEIAVTSLLTESPGASVTPERVVAMAVFRTILIGYTINALHAGYSPRFFTSSFRREFYHLA